MDGWMDGSGFVLVVLAGEGHGEAVDGEGEGAELDAALGLGGGPSVLGGEVVAEDEGATVVAPGPEEDVAVL